MNIHTACGLGRLAGLALLGGFLLLGTAQAQSWTRIAGEDDNFTVGGTQTVRYGWGTSWVQLSVSGAGECSTAYFGSDPADGHFKQCDLLIPASGAPGVSLASSANPNSVGQGLTLTATVSSSASGAVRFLDGLRVLGSATLNTGSATLSTVLPLSGAHPLVAVYLGDASHSPGVSASLNQTVTGPSGGSWTKLADEDQNFSLGSGTRIVRFGAGSSWIYLSTSGNVYCETSSFGATDPAEGSPKQCDVLNAGGSGTLPAPPVSPVPVANYEYDAQGNPTQTTVAPGVSGFNFATQASYDALSRRKDTTDAKSGVTQYGYDGADRTTSITDPRNLQTQYPRNGLGDTTSLVSPDTGTATHTYDAAGNLATRTDSRGVLASYSYDALNRPTGIVYSQSGQSQSLVWTYDQTGAGFSNGIGRLTSTSHPNGASQYAYDAQGRLVTETQSVSAQSGANAATVTTSVAYGYTNGQLTSLTYPSGRVLSLSYTAGQLSAIGLAKDSASTPATLLDQIAYAPFGGPLSWNWQMASGSQANQRIYDTSGRLVRYQLGSVVRDLVYDAADRIVSYTHYDATSAAATPGLDQGFVYDELGRLINVVTGASWWSIGYDANGNRTSVTVSGNTSAYTTSPTSNRLTAMTNPARSFGYDSAGNTTSDSTSYTSTYSLAGRLATLSKGGITSSFSYDVQGRRVRKVSSSGAGSTVIFVYDQNDQLLGEYDQSGTPIREYVWLGSTPVAMFTPDPASSANPPLVYFIHADHIDTPRVVVDRSNNIRWRWMAEPFGTTAAETNPQSLGAFSFPLRMPGQYADSESGLFYNYFRNYDPSRGYIQPDPIGLAGGSVSLYTYANNQPTRLVDPMGLQPEMCAAGLPAWCPPPPPPPSQCPPEKCSNPVTVTFTTNNVCAAGDTLCAQAMQAAGLQGPYFPQTTTGTYSLTCLLKLGIGVKATSAVAGTVAGKYLPGAFANGLGRVGLPVAGAYVGAAGTTVAEISSGPIGITASVVGAAVYLAKECKCE